MIKGFRFVMSFQGVCLPCSVVKCFTVPGHIFQVFTQYAFSVP